MFSGEIKLFGYAGKFLYIDLTHQKFKIDLLRRAFCERYIGGNGFSIRLLYDNTKRRIDPFSPQNALVFAVGPFVGTAVPTSGKYIIQAKSPLTNFMGESVASGLWGPMLKWAGYDAIVIKGRSDNPIYLFIDDDIIEFRDAKNLWGKDTLQTAELIKEEIGDENVCVTAIGAAGEHLVRLANITSDQRQAGRTGIGAVMGSKKLKAIAVRGTKGIEVFNLDKLMETCRNFYARLQSGAESYTVWGTAALISKMNTLGALPTKNWQQSTFDLAEKISGEYLLKHYVAKVVACAGCPIACDHISVIKEGDYSGTVASVDYESLYALGPECGVGYFPAIAKANDLCDRLGMDTISTGVTIGWAMECFERGVLSKDETDGIELTFGSHEALIEVIRKIAYREGIGNLLAEGVKKASQKVGKGSEHFAMHIGGLEIPGYDIRSLKASALGFMTSTRGACHVRSMPHDIIMRHKADRFKADKEIARWVKHKEDLWTMADTLMFCKFCKTTKGVCNTFGGLAELYAIVTGIEMTAKKLKKAGERIWNLEKAYNIREGWNKKDSRPPLRVIREPVPSGPAKGARLTEEEIETMLSAYYEARGWTKDGIPTKQKLIDLELNHIADDIWKKRR